MTAPFTYLDAPAVPTLNAPPALPTFIDGSLVHQGDLNALSANLNYLQAYALGGHTADKPLTVLRQTAAQSFPSGDAITINWSTADKNTDNAWSFAADTTTVYVQTAGYYRIAYQGGHLTSNYSQSTLFIMVNGADIYNNSIAVTAWLGNIANVEVSTQLAATASIQVALLQTSGVTVTSSTAFGGQRLAVEWLSP